MSRFETVAVHAGTPEGDTGPVVTPISLSTTFKTPEAGVEGDWVYARAGNPTRAALEEALNALEGGAGAGAFSSGLAAIDCVLRMILPRSKVVIANDVYGGTWRLLDKLWRPAGFEVVAADLADLDAAGLALKGAALVIIESPSNPLLRMFDIAALAALAHDAGALVCVDNTFATPYLQKPLGLGADFVAHSTTKYLGGHSDVVGGALVASSPEHAEQIHYLQKVAGAVASPFDSFLVLRGIRTLAVRMDRAAQNAAELAKTLAAHAAVKSVCYPGLERDAGYSLCQKQMSGCGGAMVSFRHAGGPGAAAETVASTKVFALAESLGAVESLIEVPASMTHASTAGSPLEVGADLIRLSVGVEHIDDLREDLLQALG